MGRSGGASDLENFLEKTCGALVGTGGLAVAGLRPPATAFGRATITSCPNSLNKRLIQGECVPISRAIRLCGILRKTSCNALAFVRNSLFHLYLARFIHHAIPTVAISQI
jgi:hypothetical protein